MSKAHPSRRATVVALALIALALALTWWPRVDRFSSDQVQDALTRALLTFAVARAMNGVISVAESAEVAVQPAGVGVSFHPGEILDPVNDLVESFSSLVLTASVSLGVQLALIEVSGWFWIKLTLSLALIVLAAIALWPRSRLPDTRVALWARKLTVILLLLRFAVPTAALASEGVYALLLAPQYERASAEIEAAKDKINEETKALQTSEPPPDADVLDRIGQWFGDKTAWFDVEQRLADLEVTVAEVTRQIIVLIAVFVLQTIVLPLAFLWLAWRLAKFVMVVAFAR
jgi:hypothetical protein